ncbi:MAG TPA: 2-amino-4-hydroxy-6-hydroxymethyldihydropteridine diphosphokinase [Thermomicrobiales bacterium]|nr:2-amino-4-hydroxy-6-hydroxymethyldihydropteridine diphosphokinase [Thermomicrobiales bacterium]
MASRAVAYIGLGANLGDRLATINTALRRIAALGTALAVSPIYESEPVGYADQPPFLNCVSKLETDLLTPERLLERLLAIEHDLGRVRMFPNAPRTIDLDILLYDDRVIETAELRVPHPGLHERAFVLIPLADLAPELVHPIIGKRVDELLASLRPVRGVWRFHQ